MKHKVTVKGIKYERYGEGERFRKTYTGKDLVKILIRIADERMYGIELEEIEATQVLEFPSPEARSTAQVEEIIKLMEEQNGDGCDFIILLEIDGTARITGEEVIEEGSEEVL